MHAVLRVVRDRKGRPCFALEGIGARYVYVNTDGEDLREGDMWYVEVWNVPGKGYLRGRLLRKVPKEVLPDGTVQYHVDFNTLGEAETDESC